MCRNAYKPPDFREAPFSLAATFLHPLRVWNLHLQSGFLVDDRAERDRSPDLTGRQQLQLLTVNAQTQTNILIHMMTVFRFSRPYCYTVRSAIGFVIRPRLSIRLSVSVSPKEDK